MQMGELPQRLAVLGVQTFNKSGIIEFRLAIGLVHVSERMQALHNGLTARRRQLLPARKQGLPDIALLFGGHLFPHVLSVAQILLLSGSQPVPGLEALTDLRLLPWRQILETLVILQELLLPFRRHILEAFNGFRGQSIRIWSQTVCTGAICAGTVWHHLLTPQLALRTALLSGRLGGILANRTESLTERGPTRQPCHQQSSQNSAELESQLHYLFSFVTAPYAAPGVDGNSESWDPLESTCRHASLSIL